MNKNIRNGILLDSAGCQISWKMSGDSGWNAVIHHPSDLELQNWNWEENDGEQEKELPSTVDMDAIKGGGSWDPATEPHGTWN